MSAPILWMRMDQVFDMTDTAKIFSNEASSPWSQALRLLGYRTSSNEPWIQFRSSVSYFNWSLLTEVVSRGSLKVEFSETQAYSLRRPWNPLAYLRLIADQWRMETFLFERGISRVPATKTPMEAQLESLVLGICALAMTLRVSGGSEMELARWLSDPSKAPRMSRRTVELLQKIQVRRTALSSAFGRKAAPESEGPAWFWTNVNSQPHPLPEDKTTREWKGVPIFPGTVEGPVGLVPPEKVGQSVKQTERRILLFQSARPEAIEHFAGATALVFATGGVLSHACTIAREQRIPCVTGLGESFWKQMRKNPPRRMRVDAKTGSVQILD